MMVAFTVPGRRESHSLPPAAGEVKSRNGLVLSHRPRWDIIQFVLMPNFGLRAGTPTPSQARFRLRSALSSTRGIARNRVVSLSSILAFFFAAGLLAVHLGAKTVPAGPAQKAKKERALIWDPPQVDSPVPSLSSTPPCSLPDVLAQAGQRANELIDHLQNFSAHERIRYDQTDREGAFQISIAAKFDYVVDFGEQPARLDIHETRTALAGSDDKNNGAILDKGLPILALIFYPSLQNDYEMRCEGLTQWNNQPAWVVHFRQLKAKVPRTMTVRTATRVYPVGLKGRAWIGVDSGQVMHLETNLVEPIAAIDLLVNSVVVDYAPVKFQSQNTEIWLPQFAIGYADYAKRRMIIEHTFSDFQLFSVQTQQEIQKPTQP
jgi:hypothetical protein